MTRAASSYLLQALRRVVEDQQAKALPDQELLHRFAAGQDEAAFLALLGRHGPTVFAVCRSLLRREADAEDAFQATFLILARKARSIRKGSSLRSWLHGVALRTARKAQAEFARRLEHERGAAQSETSNPETLTFREVQQVLHEELNHLSDRARIPLTLYYLQGKTLDEAAGQLGVAKSTLKTRLERARELLRARLERRGLGSSVELLAAALPARNLGSLAKAAVAAAAGQSLPPLTPARVAALTNTMLVTRRHVLLAALAVLAIVTVGLAGLLYPTRAQEPDEKEEPGAVAREDNAKKVEPSATRKPKEIAFLRGHTNVVPFLGLSADGRTLATGSFDKTVRVWDLPAGRERFALRGHKHLIDFAAITADGKTIASADQDGVIKLWDAVSGRERFTLTKPVGPRPHGRLDFLAFTADGRTLAWQRHPKWVERHDVATGKKLPALEVTPNGLWVPEGKFLAWEKPPAFEFSPDRKCVVVNAGRNEAIQLWELATGKLRLDVPKVTALALRAVAFHPGGRVLACGHRKGGGTLNLVDVATGEVWAELTGENCDGIFYVDFSADGNTLAVSESPDTAIRVWDVSGIWRMKPPFAEPRSERDLESLWADLAGDDAAKAYRALWTLAGAPRKAAPWIGRHLPPVVAADEKVTAPLLAGLDHDRLADRDQATRKFEDLGEAAWPALEKARKAGPSPEVRRRVERLLAMLERAANTPEHLRVIRAVEALERAGTREASEVLQSVARGTPQALRTREAKAALDRLARRGSKGAP